MIVSDEDISMSKLIFINTKCLCEELGATG
jgi:hypothetical protein